MGEKGSRRYIGLAAAAVIGLAVGGGLGYFAGSGLGQKSGGAGIAFEQKYFARPEEAVQYYTDSIAEGKYTRALNACSVENRADQLDFVEMMDALGGYSANMMLPDYDLYRDMNVSQNYAGQVGALRYLLLALCADDPGEALSARLVEKGQGEALYEELDPDHLKDFRMLRCERIQNQPFDERFAESHGYLDYTEYNEFLTLYQADGDTYIGGFGCAKDGNGWTIVNVGSLYAGISLPGVERGSEEEFEELLDSLSDL